MLCIFDLKKGLWYHQFCNITCETRFVWVWNLHDAIILKQAGTGPSRCHIQGSKIAKGRQSFKVFSSTALKNFLKKVSQRQKKIEGIFRPFGIFLYPVCRKTQKNEGWTLWDFFPKKVSQCRKKLKGIVCYAGNFLVLFPGPTGEIWNFVELLVELFWLVQVVLKKHWRKAMTIVDSFLKKSAD